MTMLFWCSLVVCFVFFTSVTAQTPDPLTSSCLQMASNRECAVFNRCCNYKCRRTIVTANQSHYCMALLGQIVADRSRCVCNGASSRRRNPMQKFNIPKFDIVAGVLLVFILDFLVLTFAL
ncbi:hypothetical protein M3Y95_00221900 [Aphelenchoides besseyi]|nr:hypothetical protein M3Y95_00221900 [Aphelenchoides besseyi]